MSFDPAQEVLFCERNPALKGAFDVEDKNFIPRHHDDPVLHKRHGIRVHTFGQHDLIREGQRIGSAREADDNHREDRYQPGDHRGGQHCHQYSQEPDVTLVFRGQRVHYRVVVHVSHQFCRIRCAGHHRGRPALAS